MNSKKFLCWLLMAFLLMIPGCQTTKLATRSGKPEVTINTTDREMVKAILIDVCFNSGLSMVSDSSYSLVFSKPYEGFGGVMYQVLLGNAYSSSPVIVVRFNLVTLNSATRVIAQAQVSMQNAFGRQDNNDISSGKYGQDLLRMLHDVKSRIEREVVATTASSGTAMTSSRNLPMHIQDPVANPVFAVKNARKGELLAGLSVKPSYAENGSFLGYEIVEVEAVGGVSDGFKKLQTSWLIVEINSQKIVEEILNCRSLFKYGRNTLLIKHNNQFFYLGFDLWVNSQL
jgi:hypothetical protein